MHILSTNKKTPKAVLYRFVFGSGKLRIVIAFMMFFFLCQPVMPALASEETAAPEDTTENIVATEVADSETGAAPEQETAQPESSVTAEATPEVSTVSPDETAGTEVIVNEAEDTATSTEEPAASTTDAIDQVVEDVPLPVVDEPIESVPDPAIIGQDPSEVSELDTEEVSESEVIASTTPKAEYNVDTSVVSHNDSLYQFNKSQCVSMGSGAYHCFDASAADVSASSDVLYVDRDADGDKEIFVNTEGTVHQITNNQLDDDAPYYDSVSDTIVWHRLVNGSYEIFSYQDNTETQISSGFLNNMEPHRAGMYTVWQAWVNDTWQIVLFDGSTTKIISKQAGQNIAPQVQGEYVIWNVTNGTDHKVAVYEIATGLVSIIDDTEGARVYNPRFVLVYDTKFDNGDIITKGYDAATGLVVPLSAQPAVPPMKIPSSDQTGETRALIQVKTQSRGDESEFEITPTNEGTSTDATINSVATSSNQVVTDLSINLQQPPATTTLILTDYDLVVTRYIATSSVQE